MYGGMTMKNFIYLNMDFLESFMAQNNDGFPEQEELEENHSHTETEEDEVAKKITKLIGEIGTGNGNQDSVSIPSNILNTLLSSVLNVKLNGEKTVEIKEPTYSKEDVEAFRNVVIKKHKDDMYNEFYRYIKEEKLLVQESKLEIGKYISIMNDFFYFDFSRILNLYKEEYRQLYANNSSIDFDFSFENFETTRNKVSFLKEILPFDAFLHRENLLVLIDKKWLRVKRKHIGYKFQGEIHVVGRIDKFVGIHNDKSELGVIDTLNKIQEVSLSMLYELGLLVSKEVYLITPITIYY